MTLHVFLCRTIRFVWWISVSWLCLTLFGIVYFFVSWIFTKDNPESYEGAIASALIMMYSFPAALGAIAAGLFPDTGLSLRRRVGGVFLLLICIVLVIVFDYLQTRYR